MPSEAQGFPGRARAAARARGRLECLGREHVSAVTLGSRPRALSPGPASASRVYRRVGAPRERLMRARSRGFEWELATSVSGAAHPTSGAARMRTRYMPPPAASSVNLAFHRRRLSSLNHLQRPRAACAMSRRSCFPSKSITAAPRYARSRASANVWPTPVTDNTRPPAVSTSPSAPATVPAW
jgi:hypothetical protein